jgi:hypothetical protein
MRLTRSLSMRLATLLLAVSFIAPAGAAIQFGGAVRNAMLDSIETNIGTSAVLKFYTGSAPANCAASATGTVLATINLPSDYMANASSGTKTLQGTWQDASADATGTAGYFRIYDSTATTCGIQGTVSLSGGGGDMIIDNTSIATGQQVNVTQFTFTAPNP